MQNDIVIKFKNNPNVFKQALKNAIEQVVPNRKRFGNSKLYVKAGVLGGLLILCYSILVFGNAPPIVTVPLCVITGCLIASIGFNIMHDGNHGSFSSRKWVNELMGFSLNILGGNAKLWIIKHNQNHHTYTNIVDHDDDIEFGSLARVSPSEQWKPWHRYQHLYMPLVYLFTYLLWIYVFDFTKYFRRKVCNTTFSFTHTEHVVFWISKLLHLFVFVVFPAMNHSVSEVVVAYLVVTMVCGFVISIVFQLAHVVEGPVIIALESDQIMIPEENAIHQVRTTSDFATNSKFINWFVGGLNFQVEHHLFPFYSHVHYPKIHQVVKEVCNEFGIVFNEQPTLFSAIRSHFILFKKLGQKPNPQLV